MMLSIALFLFLDTDILQIDVDEPKHYYLGSTGGTGFSAIKITALGRPEILVYKHLKRNLLCLFFGKKFLVFILDILLDPTFWVFGEDSKILYSDHWQEGDGHQGAL